MAKRFVRALSRTVDNAVLLTLLVILIVATFGFWDTWQVYAAADVSNYEQYKPAKDDTMGFEELRAMNPDVMGWITIYDTGIDYPMVHPTKDNDEYMSRNPQREFSSPGSIFLDIKSAADFSDFNTIIFGHHMSEHKMFGDIDLFLEGSFFDSHQYGNLYYDGKNHGLEIVGISEIAAGDPVIYQAGIKMDMNDAKKAYLEKLYTKSRHWRDASNVSTNDHIVILSTCSADITNGRFVLVCRVLDHEVENPFPDEVKTTDARIDVINTLNRIFLLPIKWWILILIGAIILIYLLYSFSRHGDKKRFEKKRMKEEENGEER